MEKYYLFLSLAFVSEIIGTVSGFGSSILFVPIASLFFDFKTVLGITAVFHVFSNLSKIFLFRSGVDRMIALKLGLPAVFFVIIGAWLTSYLTVKPLETMMSVALIGSAFYLLINYNRVLERTNSNLYIGGAASGFLAGIAGTGGAVRGIALAAFDLPKITFIATSALIDLGVDGGRAIIYLSHGYFKKDHWILIPFLIIIGVLGSYLGKVILNYTSETIFKKIVLGVVICTSVIQLVRSII